MILPRSSLSSCQQSKSQPLRVINLHSDIVGRPVEGGLDAPAAEITICVSLPRQLLATASACSTAPFCGLSPMQLPTTDCTSGRSPRQPFGGPGNVLAQIAYDKRLPAAGDTAALTILPTTTLGRHLGAPCPAADAPNGSGTSDATAGSEAAGRLTDLQAMLYNRQLRNYQRLAGGTQPSLPQPGKRGRLVSLYRKLHVTAASADKERPPSTSPSSGPAWMGIPPRADILSELAGRAAAAGGHPFESPQFFPNTVPRNVPDCLLFNVGQYPTSGRWGRLAASAAEAAKAAATASPQSPRPAPGFAAASSASFPRSAEHHWGATRRMFLSVQQRCNSGTTLAGRSQSRS